MPGFFALPASLLQMEAPASTSLRNQFDKEVIPDPIPLLAINKAGQNSHDFRLQIAL